MTRIDEIGTTFEGLHAQTALSQCGHQPRAYRGFADACTRSADEESPHDGCPPDLIGNGYPATMSTKLWQIRATRWLTSPSRSRNARPEANSGTMPPPTSFEINATDD